MLKLLEIVKHIFEVPLIRDEPIERHGLAPDLMEPKFKNFYGFLRANLQDVCGIQIASQLLVHLKETTSKLDHSVGKRLTPVAAHIASLLCNCLDQEDFFGNY